MRILDWFKRRGLPEPTGLSTSVSTRLTGKDEPDQQRTLENPSVPLTAEQLSLVLGYGPTRSGVQINERTAITYPAVFAAVRIRAEAIAMLPLVVYRGNEEDDEREPAYDHPLWSLLRHEPNPDMTASGWKETSEASCSLWGNSYSQIIRNRGGDVAEIRPIDSSRLHPKRIDGELVYVFDSGAETFRREEVLHFASWGMDGIVGLSPITFARETIALGKAAELYGAGFFGQGGNMDAVISFDGKVDHARLSLMRESWQKNQAGLNNAHKTAFIDHGGKYQRIGIPPEDAQFLETRKFEVIDIARIFRVPPHMLGDMEKAGYASIEQLGLEFLTYTLAPTLAKYEQELTRKLIGIGQGYHIKFDVGQLLRADLTAQQAWFSNGRQWGYFSVNDVRRQLHLPRIDNGDGYLQPVNMQALGSQPQPAPLPAQPPGTTKEAEPDAATVRALMHPVFEDAVLQILKRERNAQHRAQADETFYAGHCDFALRTLEPAFRTLCAMLEIPPAAARPVVDQFAQERHAAGEAAFGEAEIAASMIRSIAQKRGNP